MDKTLTFALSFILLVSTVRGAITVVDGTPSPAYPPAMPDPWIVGGTLTPNGTIAVDGTSAIQAGALSLEGRLTVADTASVSADTIAFRGTTGPTDPDRAPGELFISGGSATFGSSTPGLDTTAYLKVTDNGTFTLNGAGGMGGDGSAALPDATSVVAISLESGGKFEATGDQTFGGDNSAFSLGPGGGDGDVLSARMQQMDTATAALNAEIDTPGSAAGIGSNTTFRIDGDACIGGSGGGINSETTLFINDGSTFEVTGDCSWEGGNVGFNLTAFDSEFTTGGSANFGTLAGSAMRSFFRRSSVDIGESWVYGNADSSVTGLTAADSEFVVGGNFINLLGGGSVITTNITNTPVTIGGDYHFGTEQNGSVISLNAGDSTFQIEGDWTIQNGASALRAIDITNCRVEVGQSVVLSGLSPGGGGESTSVYSFSESDFKTGGAFTILDPGSPNISFTVSMDQSTLDIGGDMSLGRTGGGSITGGDGTMFFEDVSGSIDGSLLFAGGVAGIDDLVMVDMELAIGGNLEFRYPGARSSATVARSRFTVSETAILGAPLLFADAVITGTAAVPNGGKITASVTPQEGLPAKPGLTVSADLEFAPGTTLGATLEIAGESAPYFVVGGALDIAHCTLDVGLVEGYDPAVDTEFTLVALGGAAPAVGTFCDLSEGATFAVQNGSVFNLFQISYVGGDGNDITLTTLDTGESGLAFSTNDAPGFDPETGRIEQTVTVTNSASVSLSSFRLMVDVPAGVTVTSRSGPGLPFIQGGALAAGQSITLTIAFSREGNNPNFSPTYSILATSGIPSFPTAAPGDAGQPTRIAPLSCGDILVETDTIPGELYQFEYSEDLQTFEPAGAQFRATGARTRFIDAGLPVTRSHPRTAGARFYRLIMIESAGG